MPPWEAETSSARDEHRGDRVELGVVGEQHRVELQVGVALLRARVDLDQPLEARLARAGRGAAPVHVAAGGPGLVQVDGEDVEVLVGLAEEQAAERHVPAGAGDDQLVVVADQAPAEDRRQPVAVGVAPDLDDRGRVVVHAALAPVGEVGQAAARAVLEVELELAGVERRRRSPRRGRTRAGGTGWRDRRSRACGRTGRWPARRSRRRSGRAPRRRGPAGRRGTRRRSRTRRSAASSLSRSSVRRRMK